MESQVWVVLLLNSYKKKRRESDAFLINLKSIGFKDATLPLRAIALYYMSKVQVLFPQYIFSFTIYNRSDYEILYPKL